MRSPQAPASSSWLTHFFLGTSISMMEKEPSPLRHVGCRSVRAATPRSTAGGFSWDLITHPRLISTISLFHLRFKRSRGQDLAVFRPMVLIHFTGRSLNGKVVLWLCPFVRPLGLACLPSLQRHTGQLLGKAEDAVAALVTSDPPLAPWSVLHFFHCTQQIRSHKPGLPWWHNG